MEPSSSPTVATGVPHGQPAQLWSALFEALEPGGAHPAVLDCGGGSGSLAVPLARSGATVTVLDSSIDALGTLLRRAAEAGVSERVEAVQGDAEQLTDVLGGQSFDLVLLHDVLSDVADPAAVLTAAASLLTPDGRLSLVMPNPAAVVLGRALSGDLDGALATLTRGGGGSFADTLVQLCSGAGLQPLVLQGLGVFSDIVAGQAVERPGAHQTLQALERLGAVQAPFRDIASRLHVVAGPASADPVGRHTGAGALD